MATVQVVCPNEQCQASYQIEDASLGKRARCKRCGQPFVLTRHLWAKGTVILGDFEVEGKLGQGGMGTVYQVRSRSHGQRFAVKRALFRSDASRRAFLAELQTWLDLPEHPHLVACRFFRTIEDEVAIFAELVEGGSLARQIQRKRLRTLEQILDAAIQLAWGLHAAHELGLVHQDVKPGNALVTREGVVKVTDFGLARARGGDGGGAREAGQSILISSGGMTRAYCSPEQAEGRPLSRRTDVWSWGVSVLEMFAGEVTWPSGTVASEVLEMLLEGPPDSSLPAIPNLVAEVLRRCFREDPAERWPTLAEAAEALGRVYQQEVGQAYSRQAPAGLSRSADIAHDRRSAGGREWKDPRVWLGKALQAAGRDPGEAEALLPPGTGSRRAQAIADLTGYEEARRIYERLIAEGRKDLEPELATLYLWKALVHRYVDDVAGAIRLYDQTIALHEQLVHREGRNDLANGLAAAYHYKANALLALGNKGEAIHLYDRAIPLYERLVHQEGRSHLAKELAMAYMNKATAAWGRGDCQEAVHLYGRAIALYERLVHREGRGDLANDLASACMNRANALSMLGSLQEAIHLYDQTIAIREQLVHQEGRLDLASSLAMAYMNKANAVGALGNSHEAIHLYDQTIALLERLVHQERRSELANQLAMAYMNRAAVVGALGDSQGALRLSDQAIAIRERLVYKEGRLELANELAMSYTSKAVAVSALGDNPQAIRLHDQAIALYERLIHQEGHSERTGDLASVVALRAEVLLKLGEKDRARQDAQAALADLQAEVQRTGRADLQRILNRARTTLAEVL